jgi:hypothetical protein
MGLHICNPSYLGGGSRTIRSEAGSGKKHETLSKKQAKSKRTGGVAQVAQCPPISVGFSHGLPDGSNATDQAWPTTQLRAEFAS